MSESRVRPKSSRRTEDTKLSKAVYCLAPMHDNIVDAVLKIMDEDGPRPMRNMRPAQKQRTGAERFEIEHHGEYEARCQPSQNRVNHVTNHNMAYPKLHDELEKRRSTTRPTAFSSRRKSPVGCACKQIKNKRRKSTNRRTKTRRNGRPQRGSPGITKSKPRRYRYRSAANFKLSRIRNNKGCQCFYQSNLVEKCVSTVNFDRLCEFKQDYPSTSKQKSLRVLSITSIKKEPKSDLESQHQEPSVPSITSYNSYLSMDHEPMVE